LIKKENDKFTVPLSDIDTIIIDNTMINVSTRLLSEISKRNINMVICDDKHIPTSQMITFEGNYKSSDVFKGQLSWNDKLKGRA
jgi:CRISPR-associated protein Cas1